MTIRPKGTKSERVAVPLSRRPFVQKVLLQSVSKSRPTRKLKIVEAAIKPRLYTRKQASQVHRSRSDGSSRFCMADLRFVVH